MSWSRRGKPRDEEILPKLEPPKTVLGPLNWVLLKMLMISARSMICLLPPPMGSIFWNATSVWVLFGVRMSVLVRGELPNVNAGAADHAPVLNQLLMQLQSGS